MQMNFFLKEATKVNNLAEQLDNLMAVPSLQYRKDDLKAAVYHLNQASYVLIKLSKEVKL